MEYLLASAVVVLIVALIGLVGLRKENTFLEKDNEALIKSDDQTWDKYQYWRKECARKECDEKGLKLSNRSLKGANTKYKATIKKLEGFLGNDLIYKGLEGKNSIQANTIKRLNISLEESYIAINAVGTEDNKKKRLELLDKFMTND